MQDWFLQVQENGCWFRKAVTGTGLVITAAGRLLVQGFVAAGAELVAAGIFWCRKMIAGAGLVAASAGKCPPVQE